MGRQVMRVTDISYEDLDDGNEDDLIVNLIGRSMEGERIRKRVYGVEPYFYVPEKYFDRTSFQNRISSSRVRRVENGEFESYDGKPLVKIVTKSPKDVGKMRSDFPETYESDIPFVRRCTADYNMSGVVEVPDVEMFHVDDITPVDDETIDIEPRVMYLDIEVRVPDTFTQDFTEKAPNEVTAITAYDSYEDVYVLFCLDPDMMVDAGEIRRYIEDNWESYDERALEESDIVFKRYGAEDKLLQGFVNYIEDREPDFMTGWNYIDFDHEYLINRMHKLDDVYIHALSDVTYVGNPNYGRTERAIDGVPAIDMMEAYADKMRYGELPEKSLDYVSNLVLGVGKVEGDDVAYDRNRTKYMAYNIVDTQLVVELDRVTDTIGFWLMIAETAAIPSYDVSSEMKVVEGFLFKERSEKEILPDTEDKDMDTISGGLVLPPSDGITDWVGVMDLKSLYPSSMITCNISPETMTFDPDEADVVVPDMPLNYERVSGDEIVESDIGWSLGDGAIGFTLDKEGILPKNVKKLFDNRAEMKNRRNEHDPDSREYEVFDQKQRAIKVIMNSFFGVSDNPYFRLSAEGLGAATTAVSRYVSWVGVQVIEEAGYDVVYGDTDSIFVSVLERDGITEGMDKSVYVSALQQLEENLNSQMSRVADDVEIPDEHPFLSPERHGTDRHAWMYEAEKLYERFLQTGRKKRYAGSIVWKEGKFVDDTDVTGYEMEKSDYSEITKRVQKRIFDLVLEGADFDELSEYVRLEIDKIEKGDYDLMDIAIPSTLTQPIEEYPNRPTKRACKYSNQYLGYDWGEGDDPWLVFVSDTRGPLPNTDEIAVSWNDRSLPDGFELDVDAHVRKEIQQPIETIIESLGYSWGELRTGRQERSVFQQSDSDGSDEIDW